MSWLNQRYYGNTVEDYLWFVGALLVAFILRKFLSRILSSFIFIFLGKRRFDVGKKRI